ncbi:MAG: cysteine desulfurase [Exilispira sp.]|jgi:cysteine desulfurase|nr:cysteine desulfurase [Exilispira sp.]
MNVYLDNNATTPIHPKAKCAIIEFLDFFGNPSSMHSDGRIVKEKLVIAKQQIANFLNASVDDIIFTSCGSESNNTILKSMLFWPKEKQNLVTTNIEHPANLETAKFLEKNGIKVSYIEVNEDGIIDLNQLEKSLTKDTGLVSIMYANNEIGTIQPIDKIAKIVKEKAPNAIFHTDAVQAAGKIKLDLKNSPFDTASISGHKLYAPKGIGILYIRDFDKKRKSFTPLIHGGHQEKGFRAGTENTIGIIALGAACEALQSEIDVEIERIKKIRDYFENKVIENIKDIIINGKNSERVPGTSNITFKYVEGESILLKLDLNGFSVSTGSACSTGSLEPSHVLMALHKKPEIAHGSIRFSFGRENKIEQVDKLIEILVKEIDILRKISPLSK